MTEKEKMLVGKIYDPTDETILELRIKAHKLSTQYNSLFEDDEKRQTIQIGDEIEFSKLPELQEKLLVKVIDLYREDSFEKLFKKVFVGEDEEKIIEKAKSMNRFYTPEQEKEYGVVGIKIEVIK